MIAFSHAVVWCAAERGPASHVSGIATSTSRNARRPAAASVRKAVSYPARTTSQPATALLNEPPTPCTVPTSPAGRVVAAGPAHHVGQHQRQQRVERAEADPVQDLHGYQPGRMVR